mmetsp:Transcript_18006/g.30659  ORF Transcript_18006/g.30659 Transcript_18006/m.30659 type:complete len:86 (+) Transcript_18006:3-260(+)
MIEGVAKSHVHQVCTLLSCLLSTLCLLGHLFYYNEPSLQKHILRIVFIIPVYSICTLASIQNYERIIYYAAIRDFYEAYVLYNFM